MVSLDDPGPGSGGFARDGDGCTGGWTSGGDGLVGPRLALVRGARFGAARPGLLDARWLDAGEGRTFAIRPAGRALPADRLEELTPQLPDPADWVRDSLEGHHRTGPRRGLDDRGVLGLWYAFRMDPDHAQVNTTFQNHKRPHPRVTFEPSRVRDLEP